MSVVLLLALALACTPAADTGGPGTGPVQAGAFALDWSLSEAIPTVPTLSWTAEGIDAAWVVFGRDGSWDQRVAVPLEPGSHQELPVLGLKPDSSYQLRVEAEGPGGSAVSEEIEVHTGYAPAQVSSFQVQQLDPERSSGGFFVTGQVTPPVALILDAEGDPVWWYPTGSVELLGRVTLARDGRSVLLAEINLEGFEDSEIRRVSLDGSSVESIATPWRHHDFVEHGDGTLAWLAHDPQEVAGTTVRGDRIVELSPGGEPTTVYSVWDHHEAGAGSWYREAGSLDGGASGWPHANALDWLPDEQAYLVSFLHLGGIAKVDRATGDELWFLGGSESTLHDAAGQADWFEGQHGMDQLQDSLLVFVNGQGSTGSRAVELALDPEAGLVEERWSYWPVPSLGSPILGDVHRFDSGNTLVTFSYNGEIHEVDETGQPLWTLSAELGGALSYMTWLPRLQDD